VPDELLTVNAVARLWGTGLTAVLQTIQSGQLLSLDRGLLVAEGRFDVPLIRRSWLETLQGPTPGASRILRPESGEQVHSAFQVAYDFHSALDLEDSPGVFDCCSRTSRKNRSPEQLLAAWQAAGGHLHEMNAGIGTTVYSLAPLDAVAVRVIAETPALPRAVTGPAPITLLDVLPLVEEDGEWRVDLPLFERRAEWYQLLTSPAPDSDDESGPSDSSSTSSDS
jgi:hypothetical protein